MRAAYAHIKVCLVRLSECPRPVFGLQRDLAPDDLHRRCLAAEESVMAVLLDAVRRDVLVPERFQDGPAREPLVEIPVPDDLAPLQMVRQDLLDIVDLKPVRRQACTRQVLRPVDELPMPQPDQEQCRTSQVEQQKKMETQQLGPR
jgi:hypothetical protein